MKLSLRTFQIRETVKLRADVEKQLAPLQELARITAAYALVGKYQDRNPPFCATVHLEAPGPEIRAAGVDHTLAAAIKKVGEELRQQILLRPVHRQAQRKTRVKRRRGPS